MTTAITWPDSSSVHVVRLTPGQRVVIGRGDQADISIDDPRISREHLAVTAGAGPGEHRLEHLSHTNPTLLNGQAVSGVVAIADGAVIQIGELTLTFHDLRAGDAISGPVCHVCGRENTDADRDCWFCGTSLLNAPTTLRELRPVVMRVVSATGQHADMYAGRWLVLRPDGSVDSPKGEPPAGAVALHMDDAQPVLIDSRTEHASDPVEHVTGDNVSVDGATFGLIAREASAAR